MTIADELVDKYGFLMLEELLRQLNSLAYAGRAAIYGYALEGVPFATYVFLQDLSCVSVAVPAVGDMEDIKRAISASRSSGTFFYEHPDDLSPFTSERYPQWSRDEREAVRSLYLEELVLAGIPPGQSDSMPSGLIHEIRGRAVRRFLTNRED